MKMMLAAAIGVFLIIYVGLNYYIGLRGLQTLGAVIPFLNIKLYWIFFWLIVLSFIGGRIGQSFLPEFFSEKLELIGDYWLAAMMYLLLIFAAVDIIRLINRKIGFLPVSQGEWVSTAVGLAVLFTVAGILVYGTWNARNPQVKNYDINIPKSGGSFSSLNVVMVSDIHLGNIMDNGRLEKMVDMINGLNPDIVLFSGDVIDESVGPFVKQGMEDTFKRLKSRLGAFAVLGNHEYYGGVADDISKHLEGSGIKVLRDSYIKVGDSFYVAGREDPSIERASGNRRKNLAEILNGADMSLPVILLDHQPIHLEEAQNAGVDLQLSGHTHRGQMFPNQIFTKRIYEVDWGYLKKDSFQVIVSSGFGTWGPPIRIGNTPEIVHIDIRFAGDLSK